METQEVREVLTEIRAAHQEWLIAVLDQSIANGDPEMAARIGGRAGKELDHIDALLESLSDPMTPEQAYAAGAVVGHLAYGAACRLADAAGTFANTGRPIPADNPVQRAVIRLREAVSDFTP